MSVSECPFITVNAFSKKLWTRFWPKPLGILELIISDNASTDRTQEICRAYVAKDQRIRYYCNAQNLGAAWNFNRVFELSRGEYFKWAAYDDTCAPTFIEQCIEVLDQQQSVILCHSKTRIIDERGGVLENDRSKLNTNSPKPYERFRDLILKRHGCFQLFGVMRMGKAELSSVSFMMTLGDHPQTSTRSFQTNKRVGFHVQQNLDISAFQTSGLTGNTHFWSERLRCSRSRSVVKKKTEKVKI